MPSKKTPRAAQPPPDAAPIRHDVNGVLLELAPRTLALCRLACGSRTWLDNGPAGESLWQLHVADAWGQRVDLEGRAAAAVTAAMDGATLRLEWRGVKDRDSGAGPFDVRVAIAPSPAGPGLLTWRLSVKSRTKRWTLWHVLFPRLCGLTPGADPAADRVFWPDFWGRQAVGWDQFVEASGPCGGYGKHAMQFLGVTRGTHTLYLGAHDPGQWPKQMVFAPGKAGAQPRRAQCHFLAHPAGMTVGGNSYTQPYDIVAGELAGDWYDAARLYAGWARPQSWVSEPPRRADHGPREAREVLV